MGGGSWWAAPGLGEEGFLLLHAPGPEHLGIVVEEVSVLSADFGFEFFFEHQLDEVADKDAFEEGAVAAAFIPEDAVDVVDRAPVGDGVGGGFFRIPQVLDIPGELIELMGRAQEGSLIVGERDSDFGPGALVEEIGHGAGFRVEEVFPFPGIDFFGPIEVFFVAADSIESAGEDAGWTVGAGVFGPELVAFPGDSAVFFVPASLDEAPETPGGIEVFLLAGNVVESQEREGDPLHIIEENIPVVSTVFLADSLVPGFEVIAVLGIAGAEPGIDEDIHGVSLGPVIEVGGILTFGVEVVAGAVPEAFDERLGALMGRLGPIRFFQSRFAFGDRVRFCGNGFGFCILPGGRFGEKEDAAEEQNPGRRETDGTGSELHTVWNLTCRCGFINPGSSPEETSADKKRKTGREYLDSRGQ